MISRLKLSLLLAVLSLASSSLKAELKLPAIISDHMVLQQKQANPIWGWDTPGTEVSVTFGKQVKKEDKVGITCKHCGLTYDDFRKFGRLGCSECYEAFKSHLSTLLKKIHGSNSHLGKTPLKIPKDQKKAMMDVHSLKAQLMKAIQMEDFEKAAELRDKIRGLEEKGKAKE